MIKRTGVVLVNLGTPSAPTKQAVKTYLWQFLRDKRVVDIASWLWLPILRGIILPKRVPKVAKLYQSIWTEQGAPLMAESIEQCRALSAVLPDYEIELAMTYGQPSIDAALTKLGRVDKLIVLPLFPQYASATTASVWDAVSAYYRRQRYLPSVHFIRDYADHPDYIAALVKRIKATFEREGKPELLLFSFHGIPQSYADEGDDYPTRCELTLQYVAEQLDGVNCVMSYQSRFGKAVWLRPYTDKLLASLPSKGIKHLHVICPGFAADCLETLEEIAIQGEQTFLAAGGQTFHYIRALNHEKAHIECLKNLILAHDIA